MDSNSSKRGKGGLSARERTLLIVFVLFAVGLGWFRFVWQPVQTRTQNADSRIETAETLITQEQIRAQKKKIMTDALAEIEKDPSIAPLPMSAYNNYLRVLSELRGQLGARSYESISGLEANASDAAGVYRRSVTVYNVVCADYAEARALVDSVAAGPYRCMIKSASFVAVEGDNQQAEAPLTPGVAGEVPAGDGSAPTPAATAATAAKDKAEETLPEEPELVYHTLLTFTVTYYEQELDA